MPSDKQDWDTYIEFWKIVGKHSKHWNYSKTETILMLQKFIDDLIADQCRLAEKRGLELISEQFCNMDVDTWYGEYVLDRIKTLEN